MQITAELKKKLVENLKITRQAVEIRAKNIKQKYGPMNDVVCYSVLCQLNKIDTSKIIDENTMARVREICSQIDKQTTNIKSEHVDHPLIGPNKPQKKKSKSQKIICQFCFFDQEVNNDAEKMAEIYTLLYVFENSLRKLVITVMSDSYGIDWWDTISTPKALKMKNGANFRIADEKRNSWHGKRGTHPIYYTDLSDFYDFIDEYWPKFKVYFPTKNWLGTRLEEISRSRNTIDHHNTLSNRDINRLQIYFEDWFNQLSSIIKY
ncbi:MAG: Swt1 family HEPN domain-containing protein [Anaerolineaceae bacterium]